MEAAKLTALPVLQVAEGPALPAVFALSVELDVKVLDAVRGSRRGGGGSLLGRGSDS